MYTEVFSIRLKAKREELGLSQSQMSADTGIDQSRISKYERGELEPNLEKLGIIANYLEVSIDWLLGNPFHDRIGECT